MYNINILFRCLRSQLWKGHSTPKGGSPQVEDLCFKRSVRRFGRERHTAAPGPLTDFGKGLSEFHHLLIRHWSSGHSDCLGDRPRGKRTQGWALCIFILTAAPSEQIPFIRGRRDPPHPPWLVAIVQTVPASHERSSKTAVYNFSPPRTEMAYFHLFYLEVFILGILILRRILLFS